jgi:hypothetical protein
VDGDDAERPPTTRIGPAGGAGRGLSTVVVLVALALGVAVLKPWDWFAPPAAAPGREGAAIPAARPASSPTVAPTPASRDWTGAGPQVACLSGTSWLVVVDQAVGPTVSRSWTRVDPVPATGPLDPAIAGTRVYADSVPRIGFCVPDTRVPDPAGFGSTMGQGDAPFGVRAWRIQPASAATGPRHATEIAPALVSGGTLADRGSLYGPPVARSPRRGTGSAEAPWQTGTYVFRVELADARPAGLGVAWFAIELRGPWTGLTDATTPAPGVPAPATPSPATP